MKRITVFVEAMASKQRNIMWLIGLTMFEIFVIHKIT